jgi:hypothetical protein
MSTRVSGLLLLWVSVAALSACSKHEPEDMRVPIDGWEGVCIDADGDGYGFQCEPGADCDDADGNIHADCGKCSKPSEGCACAEGTAPVACSLAPELTSSGSLICRNGTRYCREQLWTACEGLSSFSPPAPSKLPANVKLQGLVTQDAGRQTCNDVCKPDCYKVDDTLGPYDGGAGATVVSASESGGITIKSQTSVSDAGSLIGDGAVLNDYSCVPGTLPDIDCDRVPDVFDTSSDGPPFQTDNKTVFMTLGAGQSATQNMKIDFKLKSADIYFLLDMTGTMIDERLNLISSLTSGSFLGSGVSCSDRNYDGQPDDELKSQGVTGNIACLIRDARFGAGWFRDIPFGPYKNSSNACSASSPCGYSSPDYQMFEHVVDISSDVDLIKSSLTGFQNLGAYNGDFPEGGMQALWPLLTGGEVWAGWDRPSTPRRICDAGHWGWPCFRNGAIPIIIHATDDEMHEAPNTTTNAGTNYAPYSDTSYLALKQGTAASATEYMGAFAQGEAEDLASALDLGDITNKFVTYGGDTRRMTADMNFALAGSCGSAWSTTDQGSPDAVFKFTLSAAKKITASTRGSRFDSTLLLMRNTGTPPASTSFRAANNGTFASAQDLGILGGSSRFVVNGDSSTHSSVYARESLNTGTTGCFYGNSATPTGPASVLKFRVAAPMRVRVSTAAAQASETALFTGSAREPTNINLASLACASGTSANCNDRVADYSVGELSGRYFHLYGGSTNTSSIKNDYTLSCPSGTYGSSNDAVVDFSLSADKNVLFETGPASTAALSSGTGFSHGLFVYKKPAISTTAIRTVPDGTSGDALTATTITSTLDVPGTAGNWVSYRGSSALDTATYSQNQVGGSTANACRNGNAGAPSDNKDIVFKFVATGATQTYEFETATPVAADGYKTWLSLHNGSIGQAPVVAASNASEMEVSPGQLLTSSINNKRVSVTGAQMNLRAVNYAAASSSALLGNNCGLQGYRDGRDAVFSFTATANGTVRVATTDSSATAGTQPGFRSFITVFKSSISTANRLTGDCPAPGWWYPAPPDARQSGNAWSDTVSVTAGTTYYVVVKEWSFSNSLDDGSGAFGLIVEDTAYASSFLGCDAGSSLNDPKFSRLTATLAAGTYYIVLKGSGSGAATQYALNVRRVANGLGSDLQGCANSASNRTRLPLSLTAGDYSLVLKGQSTNKGGYSLSMRDLAVSPEPTDCSNGTSSVFTSAATLSPGIDYYVVTRGNSAGGAYQLMIEDSGIVAATTATACDDNGSASAAPSFSTSSGSATDLNAFLSVNTLAAGDYYLIVKGKNTGDQGWFQVSVGDETKVGNGTFAPKKYYGTGGVKQSLDSTQTKVITIWSSATSDDGYMQSQVLSAQSGATTDGKSVAVGGTLPSGVTPLTYAIPSDGSGLGSQVVQAVDSLVKALKMNLTVVLSPSPESPPAGKPFGVKVEAYGSTSNCSPTILDTDANGLADSFVQCGPGAAPNFRVTFENPAGNPVPPNPADPEGGYNMKLLLLGNRDVPTGYAGTVVDEIPVYIIPAALTPPPTSTQYVASGVYEQTVSAQCEGTATPIWRALSFNATTPVGTSTEWKFCGGDSDSEVASCSLQSAGTLTSSGVACSTSNQLLTCGLGSYCNAGGTCETFRSSRSCTLNADCGSAGVCVGVSGTNRCQASSAPIDVADILSSQQGRKKMRVNIVMNASSDRQKAPTIYDWRLDYYCSPGV